MAKGTTPAIMFQHPRSPVRLDDPQTDASIIRSQAATILELQGVVKQLSKTPPLHPEPEFHPVTTTTKDLTRSARPDVTPSQQHAPTVLRHYAPDEAAEILDTQEALERLAGRIGWRRLANILRNTAFINGEDI